MQTRTAYLTIVEAQRYFDGRLNTDDWDRALAGDKSKALIQASTLLDNIEYVGIKVTNTQEHEFPRDFQDPTIDSTVYDTDDIPIAIKEAVCEQALALLGGYDPNKEIDGLSAVGVAYSSVKTNFDRSSIPMHTKVGLCATAWQKILPFIRDNRNITLSRV